MIYRIKKNEVLNKITNKNRQSHNYQTIDITALCEIIYLISFLLLPRNFHFSFPGISLSIFSPNPTIPHAG